MSGGSLDYFYSELESHIGDFKDKELDDLIKDLVKLFHDREWYLSGDTCEGDWIESRDNFKKKWFSKYGRQDRIEKYLNDIKEELFSSLGLSSKYCKNCKHWEVQDDPYGWCDFHDGCMMHRSEYCDKFEDKE